MAASDKIKEELEHILMQVANSLKIENFEINSSAEGNYGDGFVAQFYTGEIHNKDIGETTNVAIKKAPSWDFDYMEIFENENIFYNTIFPALNDLQINIGVSNPFNNIPKYFCGELEPKKEYIAMENLKPLGYVMFDKMQYLDKEHLEMIFKIYGKFHALSFVLRNNDHEKYQNIIKDLNDVMSKVEKFVDKPMVAAVTAAINALDLEKDKIIYEEVKDLATNLLQNFIKTSSYTGEHKCLVHGDCWSNNMLFKYSESGKLVDIKLIDFQICQENSPINDLSYFFYSGAAKTDMDNLENYLQIYYQSFSEFTKELGSNPEKIFSFKALKKEWKQNALYGVIMGIYLWQVKLIPKEDFVDIVSKVENPTLEENLNHWTVLLENVHKTDAYKERTTAILRHAFEYGVLNKDNIVRKN